MPRQQLHNMNMNSTDIDECLVSNGDCAHSCMNLEGGHVCSCREGFALAGDGKTCDDENECFASECSHGCVNTPGSYLCACNEGYFLELDGSSCSGNVQNVLMVRVIMLFYVCRLERVFFLEWRLFSRLHEP